MFPLMLMKLNGSVGQWGDNAPADVKAVQDRLNVLAPKDRTPLEVDGKSGPKTVHRIKDFQVNVCNMKSADGRVDPGGKTERALNDANSMPVWSGSPQYGTPTNPATAAPQAKAAGTAEPRPDLSTGLPADLRTKFDRAWTAVMSSPAVKAHSDLQAFISLFLKELCDSDAWKKLKGAHAFLDLLKQAVEAGKIVEFLRGLKVIYDAQGSVGKSIELLQKASASCGNATMMRGIAAFGKSAKLARAFKGLGNAAAVLGLVFAAVEAENHLRQGRYGAAAKEIYKAGMGIAVPWAAIIDAVQTAMENLFPEFCKTRHGAFFFEVLRASNLLDHGGNAVDTIVTTIETVVISVQKGQLDTRKMEELVKRMEQSSGKVLVNIGNDLGDAIGEVFGDWLYENFLK